MRGPWQRARVYSIAAEVAASDATPQEGLRGMQIAARESGFDRSAVGKLGERGPWQVLGGHDFSWHEALRRMRVQGMVAFVGCRHAEDEVVVDGYRTTCQHMIDNRIGPADRYLAEHPAPPSEPVVVGREGEN